MHPHHCNRRTFLQRSAALALTTQVPALLRAALPRPAAGAFRSAWAETPDRVWLGPEYWANPLQDWHIAGGRIECVNAAADRNVHVLTRQLGAGSGDLALSVRLGRIEGGPLRGGKGSAGFRVGAIGPLREYRNSLIFGRGLDAGLSGDGALFIGEVRSAKPNVVTLDVAAVELRLTAKPAGDGYIVQLTALDPGGRELGTVSRSVPASQLVGNLALVSNFGAAAGAGGGAGKAAKKKSDGADYAPGVGRFWFADWQISGSKVEEQADHAFGPILFSQYTLSGGVLKLTAQMPPIGAQDSPTVRLQIRRGTTWSTLGEEKIHPEARTATFRIAPWDDTKDWPFRLVYALKSKDGRSADHEWTGTVRRDPTDQTELKVADISCNIHAAFPNHRYVANLAKLNPDLLAFVGDQFYESSGGYGIIREPVHQAMIDYLRKWFLHGWTWRELMRDRPSVSLPDDHDVYQGNVWGEGGAGRTTTQEAGGYDMPAAWVNVVYRTQTAHHPDPDDPAPGKRGTINWYGPLTYGRVSFAIVADRQYKSGPEGKVPKTDTQRGDHVMDPNFDPKTADVPGLDLLGAKQEQFLRTWAGDWRHADMKAVISQTIFTSLPTTHGGTRMVLRADYDSNGWPQTPRRRALGEMRKAFAIHLAGDQHLPALVQYGVDGHRDGPIAFAGPAMNTGYPRWWEPQTAPWTRPQNAGLTGDFTDSFGNPLSVLAVKNGAIAPRPADVMQLLDDKASGLGVVRFNKAKRTITIECWPFLADPTQAGTQFPGWPVTVNMLDNYARKAVAHLPMLRIAGSTNPVVHVIDETNGELVYALRLAGPEFQPHVFAPGRYTVKISEPESGKEKLLRGLEAKPANSATQEVRL